MPFKDLLVTEIFHSIQGETSLAGIPFAFIRLSGCNLRCVYCDSAYAFKGGRRMRISEVISHVESFNVKHILLTGGEPLLQRQTLPLIRDLQSLNFQVSIETHGEVSIEHASPLARIVMDIKTPSSGMCRFGYLKNLRYLKPTDEIKFVIASKTDYVWARDQIQNLKLPVREILLSPAVRAADSPGHFTPIEPSWLAEAILRDRLAVRMQLQLHKMIWGPDRNGV